MSKKKIVYIKKSDAYRCAELEKAYKVMMYLSELPAEDARLIKHGKWISLDYGNYFKCSKCKYKTEQNNYQYCPNCGAIMDLKEGK